MKKASLIVFFCLLLLSLSFLIINKAYAETAMVTAGDVFSSTPPNHSGANHNVVSHEMASHGVTTLAEHLAQPYEGPNILINVAARQLTLYNGDTIVATYPIAVGSSRYRTPLGEREMSQIIWNPWWLPPKDSDWAKGAKDTPPGPHNPLGRVKMDLGGAILVHGTNKEHTVGTPASHGCMRMIKDNVIAVARYIQEQVTTQSSPELFDNYEKKNRQSFHVKLENPVPVNIVYDLVAIRDGELNLFSDVYYKHANKIKLVEEKLQNAGYDLAEFDVTYLAATIKESKNKDLSLKIDDLLVKNRQKIDDQNQATEPVKKVAVVEGAGV